MNIPAFLVGWVIGGAVALGIIHVVGKIRYRRLCARLDREDREHRRRCVAEFDAFVAELDRKFVETVRARRTS